MSRKSPATVTSIDQRRVDMCGKGKNTSTQTKGTQKRDNGTQKRQKG